MCVRETEAIIVKSSRLGNHTPIFVVFFGFQIHTTSAEMPRSYFFFLVVGC